MQISYADPIDPDIVWYGPHTLLLGMANVEDRNAMLAFFNQHHATVFDLYRNPEMLLKNALTYPCFLRVLDFETFGVIEQEVKSYLDEADPITLTPTVVYGASKGALPDNIAIIDASATHPTMMAGFYTFLVKNRPNML